MIWTKGAQQSAKFQTFHCPRKISPNFSFDTPLLLKVYKISAKSVQRSCLMTLKSHAKFEEKLTCGLESDIRNLTIFYQNTWQSQNWNFDGILLSKVENALAKNLQRSYVMTMKNDKKI